MTKKKSIVRKAVASYKKGVDRRVGKARKKLKFVNLVVPGLGTVIGELFDAYENLTGSQRKEFQKLKTKSAKEKFLSDHSNFI